VAPSEPEKNYGREGSIAEKLTLMYVDEGHRKGKTFWKEGGMVARKKSKAGVSGR